MQEEKKYGRLGRVILSLFIIPSRAHFHFSFSYWCLTSLPLSSFYVFPGTESSCANRLPRLAAPRDLAGRVTVSENCLVLVRIRQPRQCTISFSFFFQPPPPIPRSLPLLPSRFGFVSVCRLAVFTHSFPCELRLICRHALIVAAL